MLIRKTQGIFFGHIISSHWISKDREKLKKIQEWSQYWNVNEKRVFLDYANHYREFFQGFLLIAAPLNIILLKDKKL